MHAKITQSHQFTLKYDPHIPKTNNFLLGHFNLDEFLLSSTVEPLYSRGESWKFLFLKLASNDAVV